MLATTGRGLNLNIDRIDTWSEVVLGLISTCCCTLCIWLVLLPVFHIVGMNWIYSWEGQHAVLYPKAFEGECTSAMKLMYTTPAQAFATMDTDFNGDVSIEEWQTFAYDLNNYLTAHGHKTMRVMPCYQEYDLNLDGAAINDKSFYKVVGSKYHWEDSMNAVKIRMDFAKKFGSMTATCNVVMDENNDTKITLAEFQNATLLLDTPPSPRNVARLFQHMDTNSDGLLTLQECHFRVAGFKLRVKMTYGNLSGGCAAMDTNGDMQISDAEFMAGTQLLEPPISESDAASIFPKLDQNGDGVVSVFPECHIDFTEFKKRVMAVAPCAFFNASDSHQAGTLSAADFVASGRYLVPPVDIVDMAELWPLIDVNHDRTVEISELWCEAKLSGTMQFVALVPKGTSGANKTVDSWFENSLTKAVSESPFDRAKVVESIQRRLANKDEIQDDSEATLPDWTGAVDPTEAFATGPPTGPPTAAATEAPTTKKATEAPTEAPTEAATTKKVTEAATTKKATEAATTEKPTEAATTEKPTEAATTEKPTEAATTEKPTEAATTEKPTEAATTEKPTEAATTEKPTEAATTEKPTEAATTEKPTEAATTEKPTEAATTEKPAKAATAEAATTKKPESKSSDEEEDGKKEATTTKKPETTTEKEKKTEKVTPKPTPEPTPAPTPAPTTTTEGGFPADFCANANENTDGMESATVNLDYNMEVSALTLVTKEIGNLENVVNSSSPEYSALYWELAKHGICLQFLKQVSPAQCFGAGCPVPVTAAPTVTIATPVAVTTAAPLLATAAPLLATTAAPTTAAPTTAAPTEAATTTVAATAAPTTAEPTAAATTTLAAATEAATTKAEVTTAAPTVAPIAGEVAPPAEVALSATQVASYAGAKASIDGFIQIYMEPNAYASAGGLVWPADFVALASQVQPIVARVLTTFTGNQIDITAAAAETLQPDGGVAPSTLSRQVNLNFHGVLADGKAVFDKVQGHGPELRAELTAAFQQAQLSWVNFVEINDFAKITYSFASNGDILGQRQGRKRGNTETEDGTPPFKVQIR